MRVFIVSGRIPSRPEKTPAIPVELNISEKANISINWEEKTARMQTYLDVTKGYVPASMFYVNCI